jgi:hypothetical protein
MGFTPGGDAKHGTEGISWHNLAPSIHIEHTVICHKVITLRCHLLLLAGR